LGFGFQFVFTLSPQTMKNYSLLLIFFIAPFFLWAQIPPYSTENFTIKEYPINMNLGAKNGFEVVYDQFETKELTKLWDDFISAYGKVKKDRKTKELLLEDLRIPGLNKGKSIDFYSRIDSYSKTQASVVVWLNYGNDFLYSKNLESDYQDLVGLLLIFDRQVYAAMVDNALQELEKELKSLQKEVMKIEKDTEKQERDIQNAKERIEKAELQIGQNNKDLQDKFDQIKWKQEEIETTKTLKESPGQRQDPLNP
jgi:hypothetical protein